jgi:hypothetical protein
VKPGGELGEAAVVEKGLQFVGGIGIREFIPGVGIGEKRTVLYVKKHMSPAI